MFDQQLISQDIPEIMNEHYFRAINIYLFKPHVINRKLFGVDNVLSFTYRKFTEHDPFDTLSFLRNFKSRSLDGRTNEEIISSLSEEYHLDIKDTSNINLNEFNPSDPIYAGYIVLNRLLPRNLNVFKALDVLAVIGGLMHYYLPFVL